MDARCDAVGVLVVFWWWDGMRYDTMRSTVVSVRTYIQFSSTLPFLHNYTTDIKKNKKRWVLYILYISVANKPTPSRTSTPHSFLIPVSCFLYAQKNRGEE